MKMCEFFKIYEEIKKYAGDNIDIEVRQNYLAVYPNHNISNLYFLVDPEKPDEPYGIHFEEDYSLKNKERFKLNKQIIRMLANVGNK